MTAAQRYNVLAVLSSDAFNTETAVLLSSLFSHDGEYSGLVQITLQRLHGRSEFALGNAVIILSVIVQYLPINVTLSKFTGMTVAYKENCALGTDACISSSLICSKSFDCGSY